MPHDKIITSSTAFFAGSRRRALSAAFLCEASLCLVALVLTVMDLGRRLVIFSLRSVFGLFVKLTFVALLAAVFILAYCLLMALHLFPGPWVNSQLP